MGMVAPSGSVYQAGTLSGNPVAMKAGIETLNILKEPGVYDRLEEKSSLLEKGINEAASMAGIDIQLPRMGSMFTVFFTAGAVMDYETAAAADTEVYARFFQEMLSRGIYLPPSQFETAFVSVAHTDGDIQATVAAASEAFRSVSAYLAKKNM